MRLAEVTSQGNFILHVVSENGESGECDVSPYLDSEVFEPLKNEEEVEKIINGAYFIEWECGADLSADTIETKMEEKFGEPGKALNLAPQSQVLLCENCPHPLVQLIILSPEFQNSRIPEFQNSRIPEFQNSFGLTTNRYNQPYGAHTEH